MLWKSPSNSSASTFEDPSTDLLPEVADATPIFGRVQLLSKEAANFKRMPRIEMKAPEDAVDLGVRC